MRLYEPLHRLTPIPQRDAYDYRMAAGRASTVFAHTTDGAVVAFRWQLPRLHVMAPPKRPRAPGKWTYPATLAVICCKTWDIA